MWYSELTNDSELSLPNPTSPPPSSIPSESEGKKILYNVGFIWELLGDCFGESKILSDP